jgi:hypothetical protein
LSHTFARLHKKHGRELKERKEVVS